MEGTFRFGGRGRRRVKWLLGWVVVAFLLVFGLVRACLMGSCRVFKGFCRICRDFGFGEVGTGHEEDVFLKVGDKSRIQA